MNEDKGGKARQAALLPLIIVGVMAVLVVVYVLAR